MESYSIIIPTKQGDESPKTKHLIGVVAQQDAFSRYSNDLLRFKDLLNLSDNQDDGDDDDDDLDALATINRALSIMVAKNNLDRLNQGYGNGNFAGASKRRRGNDSRLTQQGNVRKTRLSWELHPCLIFHDFMLELEALDNGIQHVPEDEEDLETRNEKQPMTRSRGARVGRVRQATL
jgi:hypothetical protein